MKCNKSGKIHREHGIGKTNIIFFIMFVLLVFIDQAGKRAAFLFLRDSDIELIPGVLELHYLENKGAAWGMMQIACVFFRLSNGRFSNGKFSNGRFSNGSCSLGNQFRFLRFCLVLLAAGAFGNLIDRVMNHYVIDFIYVSLIDFPVFNFADCFVSISAVLILYCILFRYKDMDAEYPVQEKNECGPYLPHFRHLHGIYMEEVLWSNLLRYKLGNVTRAGGWIR